MEDVAVEICKVGILGSRACLFLVKHNWVFGGYYKRKNNLFLLTNMLSLITSLKEPWGKKLLNSLAKFLFINRW